MTPNPTAQPTQDTKAGSSETVSKRIKRKTEKIKEVEAIVSHDGKITYENETGEQEEYVIDNYQDFNVALGMCQTENVEAMEVAEKFYDTLTRGRPSPFICYGNPMVKVFAKGRMEKGLKILTLDKDVYLELLAKKARKENAEKAKTIKEIELD